MEEEIIIRKAERTDCQTIRNMIQELADFEKMSEAPKINCKDLETDGFDTKPPRFTCYIATLRETPVGFTLFYDSYSPWGGKSLLLEELYVAEKYRDRGIGSMLFEKVAQIAYDEKYYKMEFVVLNWNPATDFYKRKGAKDVTVSEKWHVYRLDRNEIKQLCTKS